MMISAIPFPLDAISTTSPGLAVGSIVTDGSANEYVLLKGCASTAIGSWVTYDEEGATTLSTANAVGPVAVAMAANTGTSDYAWYQVRGTGTAKVATGFADNGKLFLTSTAGVADDAAVTGDLIFGAIGRSAISNGVATVQLYYPFVTDTDAVS